MAVGHDPGFARLCAAVRSVLGIRLEAYRGGQLERRLAFFRRRYGLRDDGELADRLRADPELRRAFADFLTINVTEFFRNPERFAELRDRHLPELLSRRGALRVWSAGCAAGAEIYSVALLLAELAPGRPHQLLGTDIDAGSLEQARRGVYGEAQLRAVPEALRRRYFRPTGEGWELVPAVRARVRFRRHDLLRDPYPAPWDLILCRNVVIYFTEAAKREVWARLAASLAPGGLLFVGGSETIHQPAAFGLAYVSPGFYRAVGRGEPAAARSS